MAGLEVNIINPSILRIRFSDHLGGHEPDSTCSDCHDQAEQGAHELRAPQFPHITHAGLGDCQTCHVSADSKTDLPKAANCQNCHPSVKRHNTIGERCQSCHAKASNEPTGHQALYAKHKAQGLVCADCHAVAGQRVVLRNAPANCLACHAEKQKTIGQPNPKQFSMAHHAARQVNCIGCHKDKQLDQPSTQVCQPCHDKIDHKLGADNGACLKCHSPAIEISPHPPDMPRADVHGPKASQPTAQCYDCHSRNSKALIGNHKDCVSCHEKPDNHLLPNGNPNPNFRYTHQFTAQMGLMNCSASACHNKESTPICVPCHRDYALTGHALPGQVKPDHSSNTSLWRQAVEDATRCVSCHEGRDPKIKRLIDLNRK